MDEFYHKKCRDHKDQNTIFFEYVYMWKYVLIKFSDYICRGFYMISRYYQNFCEDITL